MKDTLGICGDYGSLSLHTSIKNDNMILYKMLNICLVVLSMLRFRPLYYFSLQYPATQSIILDIYRLIIAGFFRKGTYLLSQFCIIYHNYLKSANMAGIMVKRRCAASRGRPVSVRFMVSYDSISTQLTINLHRIAQCRCEYSIHALLWGIVRVVLRPRTPEYGP